MSSGATLYVALSAHGYGHVGQTAPVVNELARRYSDMRVVVECEWPHDVLAQRFTVPFEHVPVATDFGMVMKDAFTVDVEESHARYRDLHARLDVAVQLASERLRSHRASLVVSNVAYVPLLAAKVIGVPAIALCCLHWADIYRALCGDMPGADGIYETMLSAYQGADSFVMPAPSMPMSTLRNRAPVGPIAELGTDRRSTILRRLQRPEGEKLVTISMGGISTHLDMSRWPVVPGVTWIVPEPACVTRADIVSLTRLNMPFLDIVCSSDALITKPGYGAFAEAACNGIPVLYVPRTDWPEAPYLTRWLHREARCLEVPRDDLLSDRLGDRLAALWREPERPPIRPTGVHEAADVIGTYLAASLGPRAAKAAK